MAVEQAATSMFGVKLAPFVAGFAGGVVSLSFLKELTRTQAFLAVFTGTTTAAYVTPVFLHYLAIPPQVENGVAFLAGLTAMNIVPGFIKLSERFKSNPESFIGKDGGPK